MNKLPGPGEMQCKKCLSVEYITESGRTLPDGWTYVYAKETGERFPLCAVCRKKLHKMVDTWVNTPKPR